MFHQRIHSFQDLSKDFLIYLFGIQVFKDIFLFTINLNNNKINFIGNDAFYKKNGTSINPRNSTMEAVDDNLVYSWVGFDEKS